jgi:hypothetical protein
MQQKFWRKVHYAHCHWIFGCVLYASGCGVSHILSVTFLIFEGVFAGKFSNFPFFDHVLSDFSYFSDEASPLYCIES